MVPLGKRISQGQNGSRMKTKRTNKIRFPTGFARGAFDATVYTNRIFIRPQIGDP